MTNLRTRVVELKKGSRDLAEMVHNYRFVMAFENKEQPDFSIENAAKAIHEYFRKKKNVLGLFSGEKLVGFAVVDNPRKGKKGYWLECLYVAPDFRGAGNASRLFDYARGIAKKGGAEGLNVPVSPDNEAMINFLRKKGYTSEGPEYFNE